MDAQPRERNASRMWRFVSSIEFNEFLRAYPRPLEAHPPLNRKARFRTYRDATLGEWPENVVAKCFTTGRGPTYEVRIECAQRTGCAQGE